MRLIDADALEKDYRSQFESVYKNIRDTVLPSDFYVDRKAAYDKELVRMEMEAFFEYLQSRQTVDAEPVRHGKWIDGEYTPHLRCSECRHWFSLYNKVNYCPNCGAKMDGGANDA